jgi:hypothetical protein
LTQQSFTRPLRADNNRTQGERVATAVELLDSRLAAERGSIDG